MLEQVLQPITREEGIERLLSGQIDACFSTDPIAGNTKIATVEMFRERLLLTMAQGHALASQTSVSLSDLSEQPYLDRLHCEFRTCVTTHLGERDYQDPAAQIRTRGFDSTGRGRGRGRCADRAFCVVVNYVRGPAPMVRRRRPCGQSKIRGQAGGGTIAHAGGNRTIVAAYWTPSDRVSML
jgi:hypothetical protein